MSSDEVIFHLIARISPDEEDFTCDTNIFTHSDHSERFSNSFLTKSLTVHANCSLQLMNQYRSVYLPILYARHSKPLGALLKVDLLKGLPFISVLQTHAGWGPSAAVVHFQVMAGYYAESSVYQDWIFLLWFYHLFISLLAIWVFSSLIGCSHPLSIFVLVTSE